MGSSKRKNTGKRIDRNNYPAVDVLSALNEGNPTALKRKLKTGFRQINKALDELRLLDPGSKNQMSAMLQKAREELGHIDEKEHDASMKRISRKFQASAKSLSEALGISIKGAGRFVDSSSDMAFLLSRYYQYRSALLSFVTMQDPVKTQKETLDHAVLIYKDDSGKYYSCEARVSALEGIIKGSSIAEIPEMPGTKQFKTLVQLLYEGREGILQRRNVFMIKAVSGAGLEAKHVLAKAASLFRAKQNKKAEN